MFAKENNLSVQGFFGGIFLATIFSLSLFYILNSLDIKNVETIEKEKIDSDLFVKSVIGDNETNYGVYYKIPKPNIGIVKIAGQKWKIIEGRFEGFVLDFTFETNVTGFVSGYGDCNDFHGSFRVSEDRITFSKMAKNSLVCEDSNEGEFLQTLENSLKFSFGSKSLTFQTKGGKAVKFSEVGKSI